MTTTGSPPTMALADLLIGLLERVPMSEAQIARATQAEPATIRRGSERREAPAGLEAQRLTELVAFVQEMARNIHGETLAEVARRRQSTSSTARNPLDELAGGRYERLIQFARGLSHGVFT